jgi:hypothetical protein
MIFSPPTILSPSPSPHIHPAPFIVVVVVGGNMAAKMMKMTRKRSSRHPSFMDLLLKQASPSMICPLECLMYSKMSVVPQGAQGTVNGQEYYRYLGENTSCKKECPGAGCIDGDRRYERHS